MIAMTMVVLWIWTDIRIPQANYDVELAYVAYVASSSHMQTISKGNFCIALIVNGPR
jgi:hypothetical protein